MVRLASVAASHTAVDIFTGTDVFNVSSGPVAAVSAVVGFLLLLVLLLLLAHLPLLILLLLLSCCWRPAVAVVPALSIVLKK